MRSRNGVFACQHPRPDARDHSAVRHGRRALCDASCGVHWCWPLRCCLAWRRKAGRGGWGLAGRDHQQSRVAVLRGRASYQRLLRGWRVAPHRDKQRLTVLVALSDAIAVPSRAATAFWSEDDGARARAPSSPPPPPALTVHAPAGAATLFCGEVTHGALPVDAGQRAVFGELWPDWSRLPPPRAFRGASGWSAMRRRVARALSS